MAFTEKDNNWGRVILLFKIRYDDGVIYGTRQLPCFTPTDDTTPTKRRDKKREGEEKRGKQTE